MVLAGVLTKLEFWSIDPFQYRKIDRVKPFSTVFLCAIFVYKVLYSEIGHFTMHNKRGGMETVNSMLQRCQECLTTSIFYFI